MKLPDWQYSQGSHRRPPQAHLEEAAGISAPLLNALQQKKRQQGVLQVIELEDGSFVDGDTGEIVDKERGTTSLSEEYLAFLSGRVGDIAQQIVKTAHYPQPELAIGAALALVGTFAGRQYAGQTRSGTH